MARCRATKANGEACKGTATGSHGYCWAHAPENAEQRHRAASKAARSKPNREVRAFKQEVKDLIADVKAGGQDRADAAVMLQGYRVLKDFVELERKIKEQDDLVDRIEELESVLEHQKGEQHRGYAR
jgi:hypothetical protein